MIEHFWKTVPGFFTFPDFYEWVARNSGHVAWHGVEVGVYEGQSAAYLGVELLNRAGSRPTRLDLIDLFSGQQSHVDRVRAALAPVASVIGDIVMSDSVTAASRYADKSLDFVFIDAEHAYPYVSRDIDAWLPKVRKGGIISGHDFTLEFPGVIQAVTERFSEWQVFRGVNWGGDERMQGKYYPCWAVTV